MRHEIKVAVYDLALLIAKQQSRGYVTEDVHCYQRHIEDAINRAWLPINGSFDALNFQRQAKP